MHPPFSSEKIDRHTRGVLVSLDEHERSILVQLLVQLDDLLDDGTDDVERDPLSVITGMGQLHDPAGQPPAGAPSDPAVARLLPEGNRDDPAGAQEYRRLTEYDLRTRKRSAARTAAGALRRPLPVLLVGEESLCLLKAMTDVRLVLGERLELRTDEDSELLHLRLRGLTGEEHGDDWMATAAIYEVLTMWQEYLVEAVSRGSSR